MAAMPAILKTYFLYARLKTGRIMLQGMASVH